MERMQAREVDIIIRALAALVLFVFIGIGVTGRQLTALTLDQSYGQAVSIARSWENGSYTVEILGNRGSVCAIVPVASITRLDNALRIEANGRQLTVPTSATVEISPAVFLFQMWGKQFVDAAITTKMQFTEYGRQFWLYLGKIAEGFRR
ncbi:MAG: hypothetical protein H6Q75_821 [Firmicutes bacterium]|nr:hypothetical protein [Bacillota bacterium]